MSVLMPLQKLKHKFMMTQAYRTTGWWEFAVNTVAESPMVSEPLRTRVLTAMGVKTHLSASISPHVLFGGPGAVIGAGVVIREGCMIDRNVTIGDRTALAPMVSIMTFTHDFGTSERRWGPHRKEPVVIGEGCWIGMNVTVLPGVTIGDGCVVAAGAVVATDTAPNGLYAGVPARRVRDLP